MVKQMYLALFICEGMRHGPTTPENSCLCFVLLVQPHTKSQRSCECVSVCVKLGLGLQTYRCSVTFAPPRDKSRNHIRQYINIQNARNTSMKTNPFAHFPKMRKCKSFASHTLESRKTMDGRDWHRKAAN